MAGARLWELCDVAADEIAELGTRLPAGRPLLMDSLWLTPEHAPGIIALRERHPLGLMLHSFPSMIDAAEHARAPRTRPTAFELKVLEALDVIIVPGRHYRDLLGEINTPIVIAEPGIDDAWRAEPRARSGQCRLVSVGAVTPRKGFLDVAEVLAGRSRADYAWSVIGNMGADAEYAGRVAQAVERLPGVTLRGQLPPERARALVQQSDVLLMPSYDENQPLVLLEAMAASVPALAYAAGATAHMVRDGEQGLVVPIGDKRALATSLERLIDDEALRQRLARNCWRQQRSLRNWSAAAREAREALHRVLGN